MVKGALSHRGAFGRPATGDASDILNIVSADADENQHSQSLQNVNCVPLLRSHQQNCEL
jgi:hypothetical protein